MSLYSPGYFRENRAESIHELIRDFPLATLLTMHGEQISHLPLILEKSETSDFELIGHMAKANPHWQELAKKPFCKAIFHGSHGYISPAWYEPKRDNVPTWNYMVVHAKGRFERLTSPKAYDAMSLTVKTFESNYGTGWQLPEGADGIEALMQEIIVFKICDLEFDAKFKLSQNQSQTNKNNVIRELKKRGDQNLKLLADQMTAHSKRP